MRGEMILFVSVCVRKCECFNRKKGRRQQTKKDLREFWVLGGNIYARQMSFVLLLGNIKVYEVGSRHKD